MFVTLTSSCQAYQGTALENLFMVFLQYLSKGLCRQASYNILNLQILFNWWLVLRPLLKLRRCPQVRILIVEDETGIASFTKRGLEEEAYAVDLATDGEEALGWIASYNYDLIVMDIMLPGLDGIALCRKTREIGIKTPVLMLTAKDSVDDRVEGLDAGADDYLVKPFAFKELLARLRALLRRRHNEKNNKLVVADLELDLLSRRTIRQGKEIELTNREFALLELLMLNQDRVLSRTVIAEHVWDYTFDSKSNVIDVYIRQLRKKIDGPFEQKLIRTVRGAGYKIQGGNTQ